MTLEQKADSVFSNYIRQRGADSSGRTVCFVCGNPGHWKDFVNGHWRKRRHMATRYSEINCQCICGSCNDESDPDNDKLFEHKLRLVYGDDVIDKMVVDSNKTVKFFDFDYQEIIDKYEKATG